MFKCKRTFHVASNAVQQFASQTVLCNVYIVLAIIIISRRIWPSHSPDLNFCDFVRYLLRCLTKSQRLKSKVIVIVVKESIQNVVFSVSPQDLCCVMNSMLDVN
jgi:hypothetical protein